MNNNIIFFLSKISNNFKYNFEYMSYKISRQVNLLFIYIFTHTQFRCHLLNDHRVNTIAIIDFAFIISSQ